MSSNVEMEIKLIIAKKDLPKFFGHPLIKKAVITGSEKTLEIENYYYDTSDYKISNAGMSYRIRKTGKEWEATVKTQGEAGGGFSARGEYTVAVKKNEPVFSGFENTFDKKLQTLLADEELQLMFTVSVTREVSLLQITAETLLEMAVDNGEILVENRKSKIEEVELEIKSGNKADLFAFVAKVAEKTPLFIEPKSKFQRGLELLAGKKEEIKQLEYNFKPDITGNAETEFKKLIDHCISNILEKQNSLRSKENLIDADKLLLVDVKRLRAIIDFVSPLLENKDYENYRTIVNGLNDPLQELYVIKRFARQWKNIYKKAGTMLRNNVLLKRLEERREIITKNISKQVSSGIYTAGLFEIMAQLENTTWQGATFLQMDQFALNRLKYWQAQLLEIQITNEKLQEDTARKMRRVIEVMVMVRSSTKIGRLDKETYTYLKALYRNLKVLNFDVYGHKDILAFLQGTNSRVLYRDAGLLLGYRLSEMPKVWRKVRKSWHRLLVALQKKK
ncbi:MAG: CYTH domain-containing protein [Acidaminococcaceae bacterium]|nr:CYTH domain-containing protein [Acidaminococcaceae bacterium]